jgi:hypothetical protein
MQPGSSVAAFAGGLFPDLPMLIMVLYATRVAGIPEREVFGVAYFSEGWQRVFAIDHSFAIWGPLTICGLWLRLFPMIEFAGSGLAHAAVDFVTHHDDARRQLWPFADWVFRSPVSYWDPAYFGNVVAPMEALLVVVLTVLLVFRLVQWWERLLTMAISSVFLVPIILTGGFHGLHGFG